MDEQSIRQRILLSYAKKNGLPQNNTDPVSEIELLKKHIEERDEERGRMMVAGKNLEHQQIILEEELSNERKNSQELIDSSDQLMSQLSKRFKEMESLKKELVVCSKDKVREIIKEDLQDCSRLQVEIVSLSKRLQQELDEVKYFKGKVNELTDELKVLKPVKGYECRKPYDFTEDDNGADRKAACVEVSGPPSSFDNDERKIPGGRFNRYYDCTNACKEDRSHTRK